MCDEHQMANVKVTTELLKQVEATFRKDGKQLPPPANMHHLVDILELSTKGYAGSAAIAEALQTLHAAIPALYDSGEAETPIRRKVAEAFPKLWSAVTAQQEAGEPAFPKVTKLGVWEGEEQNPFRSRDLAAYPGKMRQMDCFLVLEDGSRWRFSASTSVIPSYDDMDAEVRCTPSLFFKVDDKST